MTKLINISASDFNALSKCDVDTIVTLNGVPCHVVQKLRDRVYIRSNDNLKNTFMLVCVNDTATIGITNKVFPNKRREFLKSIGVE